MFSIQESPKIQYSELNGKLNDEVNNSYFVGGIAMTDILETPIFTGGSQFTMLSKDLNNNSRFKNLSIPAGLYLDKNTKTFDSLNVRGGINDSKYIGDSDFEQWVGMVRGPAQI